MSEKTETTVWAVWINEDGTGWHPCAMLGNEAALAMFAHSVTAGNPICLADPDTGRIAYRFDGK